MLKTILCVALGGMVGSVARYSLSEAAVRFLGNSFPYGTLFVNVLGCFAIGIFGGYGIPAISETTRLLLITGLLGALTTFSTFSWESIELMQNGKVASALTSIGLNLVVSLVAVYGGYLLGCAFKAESA